MTDNPRAEDTEFDMGPNRYVLAPGMKGCWRMGGDDRWLDLSTGETALLGYAHPKILSAIGEAPDSKLPAKYSGKRLGIDVTRLLCEAFPGTDRVDLCSGHADALLTAFSLTRTDSGSSKRVVIYCTERGTLDRDWLAVMRKGSFEILVHTSGAEELERVVRERGTDVAAIVLDELDPARADRGRSWAEIARRRHVPLIFDEWDTAFRVAAAGMQHELAMTADLTVVGGGLDGGFSFGAVLGDRRDVEAMFSATVCGLAAARATLELLAEQPVHERLAEIGEHWRTAFAEACAEHDIHARLEGPAAKLTVVFDGQENADPPLLGSVFLDELIKAGACASSLRLYPCAAMTDDEVRIAEDALRRTVARLRTLLIEHNSYLSGGLAWAFPGADTPLAERGLAIYRFPAEAEVDVVAEQGHVRISFHAGDLGEVTSSGFYVPTRVRGDFTATASYRLPSWQPGAESASFALFAQNEPSTLRYYAQRRSAGDGAHELLANFNNDDLSAPRAVTELEGALRVQRRGDVVSCWHRAGGDWMLLGEHRGDPADDMIIGSKIWSSGSSGALEAELSDLRVDGEIPQQQLEAVPIRPDPRHQAR